MITTKQRALLKGLAMNMSPSMQIGKDGIKDESLKQIEEMLEAKELAKIKVLNSCENSAREVADIVQQKIGCDVVQVIGNTLVLYCYSNKKGVKHIAI